MTLTLTLKIILIRMIHFIFKIIIREPFVLKFEVLQLLRDHCAVEQVPYCLVAFNKDLYQFWTDDTSWLKLQNNIAAFVT